MSIQYLVDQCQSDKEIESVCLNHLIYEKPSDTTAIEILFDLYMRTNNFQEAFECADKLWELNPARYSDYGFKVADSYLVYCKFNEALKVYKKLLDCTLDNEALIKAQFGLAQCCLAIGELDEARKYFEKILEKNPDSYGSLCGMAIIYEKGDQPLEALNQLSRAKEVQPDYDFAQALIERIQKNN